MPNAYLRNKIKSKITCKLTGKGDLPHYEYMIKYCG